MTKEELKTAIDEVLTERARVDSDLHCDHHAWLQAHIEREKARNELIFGVAKAVAQWSVLGLLGAVWYFLKHGNWPG